MQHILTDDYDLGDGWTLYTEYKPVDEDVGIWGWHWVIESESEGLEYPLHGWPYLSVASRPHGGTDIRLPREIFGPFVSEDVAKKLGISFCTQIKNNPERWGQLTGGK